MMAAMNQVTFQNALTYFYQNSSTEVAADAIRWWVTKDHSMQVGFDENPCNLYLYAFVRLGQLNPSLIRRYETLFEEANQWGKQFLARVLAHIGDEASEGWAQSLVKHEASHDLQILASQRRHDPIRTLPIVSPVELDLNWMEFFLTGSQEPLEQIASCLSEWGFLKGALNEWLSRPFPFARLMRRRRQRQLKRLADETGIICHEQEVLNVEDLDCLILQEEGFGNITYRDIAYALQPVPIHMPMRARLRMAIKMAAKWSLFSNALQHAKVREFCRQQLESTSKNLSFKTFAHLSFLDIAINLEMAQGTAAEALRLAKSFIELDPHSRRVAGLKKQLSAKEHLHDLMALSVPKAGEIDAGSVDHAEARALLLQCGAQSAQAQSYYSFCRLRIPAQDDQQEAEWLLTYERNPERFEVIQRVGDDYDRWFTIDGRCFHELHLLAQKVPENAWDGMPINRRLQMDGILPCLSSMRVTHYQIEQKFGLGVLSAVLPDVPELAREFGASVVAECRLVVWIAVRENEPAWLVRFLLEADQVVIDQAFSGFDEAQISTELFT
jgi:hypothetical protein